MNRFGAPPLVAIIVLLVFSSTTIVHAEEAIDFNRDIKPILSNRCFECHGPDEAQREAELRLDTFEGATLELAGGYAVVPGNPGESELIRRVSSDDEDERMPPVDHDMALSAKEISRLTKWIQAGAKYDRHWSFEPIRRPPRPETDASNWPRNPIDDFILRRLSSAELTPSPEADRETLIRRVYLDLLGLPPSWEEVDRFLNDDRDNAYERLLTRVMGSRHFGERWGRHWLDQARYADSHGYTNDNARSIWPYRDWVIEAFNRDLPFDQFTIEQLAGDMLSSPTTAQRVATGYHRNTLINSEGGTKTDQFRDEQVKDRIDTTGLVWMGLTVGCAKCHSHKFDPITQEEYYQLYAFFNSTKDQNSVTPTIKVPSQEQLSELQSLRTQQSELKLAIDNDRTRPERQEAWEQSLLAKRDSIKPLDEAIPWTVVELSAKSDQESTFALLPDKSVLVTGSGATKEEYQSTTFSPLTKVRSVRVELLTDERLPEQGPGRAEDGNFLLSEFWFRTGDGRELRFAKAVAEHSETGFDVTKAIDGNVDTGWAIGQAPEGTLNRSRTAWFVLPKTLEVEEEHALIFKMQFHSKPNRGMGRFRISISSEEWIERPDPFILAKLLSISREQRSPEQQARIDRAFVQLDPQLSDIEKRLAINAKRMETIEREIPLTMILEERDEPRPTHVQIRGEFLRTAAEVRPGVPSVLPAIAEDSADRLAFARWLVNESHPLTSRVRVNRIWMRLFGKGIVETESDFGTQGSLPTHPELLDWLATEFIRQGWSTKRLLHLIMSSATYRQASHQRPKLKEHDPANRLLGRQNRLRVEAEVVRDLGLAVAGVLSEKIGGPGVYPPQPDGVYAFTQRKKQWKTSQGEERFRRGMYTFFYRSAPYPMLTTFDVPKFNTVCTCRDRSNTPLQSLTLANSEAFTELADRLGDRLRVATPQGTDNDKITLLYRLCMSRSPRSPEVAAMQDYVEQCRSRFNEEADVWSAAARVVMNLDEFVTRE